PAQLVDVRELPLDTIELTRDGSLRIGATVTNSDLAAHPEVRRRYPALAQAVLAGASGQLRNMATVGGNLLQRTRCGYFADVTKPCNKRVPGSGCPAIKGEHHNHAILGASDHCVATHPSDMGVALTAFDAVVSYETTDGPGELPLSWFYLPVGDTPHRETDLPPGALITHVTLPPAPVAANSRYRKVRERASYAFAIGSIAAALDVQDGVVRDVRLAFGAVASRPWRARAAERVLAGAPADAETFAAAADAELAAARPLPHNGYKVTLMRNLVVAELTRLAEEAGR
ncbi:FAD binding domain-containing protein, partial [Streptomyces sp. NPDC058656]